MSLKLSVKDFVLSYFDRLGATIAEADDVYTVTPSKDAGADWPFARPFTFSFTRKDDETVAYIAIGSNWLKQIIEDCSRRGKVTSRHLVANSVPTATLFAERLGLTNAKVKSFQMVQADTATALCFAHLITYDAPAFGKSEAEIQMDVLDSVSGERDNFLSDGLFELVTVPFKPEMQMDPEKIDWLHERARYLSNYRSEKRARNLNKDLELRWKVEESRITKYYDQLAQALKDKENTFVARIETLETKIADAKEGSAGREKLTAELETTWARLNELNATVEESMKEIEEGRAGKLAAERTRHELSVRSDLVNASYLAYDAVTFRVVLEGPGKPGEVLVRYIPIKDDLDLPPCPHCGRAMQGSTLDVAGHLICTECADSCARCRETLCPECRRNATVLGSCPNCQGKHVVTVPTPAKPPAAPIFRPAAATAPMADPAPAAPQPVIRSVAHVQALIDSPVEPVRAIARDQAPEPAKAKSGKVVALPTASRHRQPEPAAVATAPQPAPARRLASTRDLDLPKVNRPKAPGAKPTRVESRMCPHCQASTQDRLVSCQCCGVSVCGDCLASRMRYCQTCMTLGVPRQEPQWVKQLKQAHRNLARAKRYMVSANQRYGVVHWQGFVGETVIVYDLWQKQVAAVRHGGLLKSLRPKV